MTGEHTRSTNMFVVHNRGDIYGLGQWLMQRRYNVFIESADSMGQPMFGLLWDHELGRSPSDRRDRKGVVVIKSKGYEKNAALEILNKMAVETEYGRLWKKNKLDIYIHGKDAIKNGIVHFKA